MESFESHLNENEIRETGQESSHVIQFSVTATNKNNRRDTNFLFYFTYYTTNILTVREALSINHYRHLLLLVLFCFFFFVSRSAVMCARSRSHLVGIWPARRSSWLRPNKATTAPRQEQEQLQWSSLISHVHEKSLKLAGRQMEKVTRPCVRCSSTLCSIRL